MKIVKGIGVAIIAIVVVLGVVYLLRSDPIGPIAGKQLTGTELPYPDSWDICNDHELVAVETNPDDAPYSVTTWCVVINDELFIPSGDGAGRTWTQNVSANPNIRIKMGDSIYPAKATRVTDLAPETLLETLVEKYPEVMDMEAAGRPQDVWVFGITRRD